MYRFRLILTFFVLLGLGLPFVLQQSFFPLMRFGMFAEAVRRDIQKEQFILMIRNEEGKLLPPTEAGIAASNLDYLLRNYYYRQETELFLKRYALLLDEQLEPRELLFIRKLAQDSSIIATYSMP
ncbi:MAG: hypothetical protein ACLFT3_04455 [Cyclobacteriaceae bacterium]